MWDSPELKGGTPDKYLLILEAECCESSKALQYLLYECVCGGGGGVGKKCARVAHTRVLLLAANTTGMAHATFHLSL